MTTAGSGTEASMNIVPRMSSLIVTFNETDMVWELRGLSGVLVERTQCFERLATIIKIYVGYTPGQTA